MTVRTSDEPTPDSIYERLVCEAKLYGHAFFGWKKTKAQREKLARLWRKALRDAGRDQ